MEGNLQLLADHTVCSVVGYWHDNVVCLSVCLSVHASICDIVAKRYILQQKYLNKGIGSALLGTRCYNFHPPTPTLMPTNYAT